MASQPVSFLDIPDLASLAQVSDLLAQLAVDPVLHHQRVWVIGPARVSHSLFGGNAAGVALRPTVGDLVHRGIIRGIGIERRWRAGLYFSSSHMIRQYEIYLQLQRRHVRLVLSSCLERRKSSTFERLHLLPEQASSPSIASTLIPVMRRLKWCFRRDRIAQLVKNRSASGSSAGSASEWLEARGRLVVSGEHERVRLAVCPGIKGILRFYESLCPGH